MGELMAAHEMARVSKHASKEWYRINDVSKPLLNEIALAVNVHIVYMGTEDIQSLNILHSNGEWSLKPARSRAISLRGSLTGLAHVKGFCSADL